MCRRAVSAEDFVIRGEAFLRDVVNDVEHALPPVTVPLARPRKVSRLPSSRKMRVALPSMVRGSLPFQESSSRQPRVPFSGPQIVPEPRGPPVDI